MLAGSLGKVWALFNELDIVENMNLFMLKVPGSWNSFTQVLESLTSLNFFGVDEFIDDMIYIPEQAPFSLNFLSARFMTNVLSRTHRSASCSTSYSAV